MVCVKSFYIGAYNGSNKSEWKKSGPQLVPVVTCSALELPIF